MERSEIVDIAHLRHPIAAPVAPERLRELVGWLSPSDGARAVDLGCGDGEWLQELLLTHPGTTGVGIDKMLPATAARRAGERQLSDRVRWIETDAATWNDGLFDVVLCVGASYAFGRLEDMLDAVRRCKLRLRPAGGHAGRCPAAPAPRWPSADRRQHLGEPPVGRCTGSP